jgi:hypothetical protein
VNDAASSRNVGSRLSALFPLGAGDAAEILVQRVYHITPAIPFDFPAGENTLLYDDTSFHCWVNSTMICISPCSGKDFGEFASDGNITTVKTIIIRGYGVGHIVVIGPCNSRTRSHYE